jgi:hypothetical protein
VSFSTREPVDCFLDKVVRRSMAYGGREITDQRDNPTAMWTTSRQVTGHLLAKVTSSQTTEIVGP